MPESLEALKREISRCDREIHEIETRPGPDKAYLTVLGANDWRHERRLLQRKLNAAARDRRVARIAGGLGELAVWIVAAVLFAAGEIFVRNQ